MIHTSTTGTATTDTAFYSPPVLDERYRPGDILRLRPAPKLTGAGPAWQVLYVSRDSHDQPIPVSGTVITPESGGDLAGGRVLVYQPSFHGLGGACAPSQLLSYGAEPDSAQIRAALARGFTVAVVDGEGLGVIGWGPHTFLAGRAAGQVMLDLGRAATRIPAANAADPSIVLWGYADGGRAAVWAGNLQPGYAPELDVRGIAAGAVVTDPGQIMRVVNQSMWVGLALAALIGLSRAHRHLSLRHVFTEQARRLLVDAEASNRVRLCERYRHPLGVWCERADPWNDPMWRHVFAHELTIASVAPTAPLHLYHGDADAIVPIAFGRRLFHDYRARGARVDWREYDGDHFRTARAATADVLAHLVDDLTHPTRV
ncbi:lipase family protein [Nocardia nova]|uniref:lipase family protein n=1 Tax=Nocardia nova TaxID=37330 RepID=UPI00378B33C2